MKRALIFSTAYLPLIGGAEVAVKEISDRLPDWSFDMLAAKIDPSLPSHEDVGRVSVYRLGLGWGKFDKICLVLFGPLYALYLDYKNDYECFWAIMASWGGFSASFAKLLCPRKPLLLTLQEGDDIEHIHGRVRWVKFLFRGIFARADRIQAISNFLADWAKVEGARVEAKVVPNGVDGERFLFAGDESDRLALRESLRRELGWPLETLIVVTTSRFAKKNGLSFLVQAMAKLSDTECRLLLIGGGEEEQLLHQIVDEYNLVERVAFAGSIEHSRIPKYLWACDVFVRPSLSEGLGNSFLEALVAGLPIIGTPVGGIPDFLRDGETGLFCQPASVDSLVKSLRTLLLSAELRAQLAFKGQELVLSDYAWPGIAEKMRDMLSFR